MSEYATCPENNQRASKQKQQSNSQANSQAIGALLETALKAVSASVERTLYPERQVFATTGNYALFKHKSPTKAQTRFGARFHSLSPIVLTDRAASIPHFNKKYKARLDSTTDKFRNHKPLDPKTQARHLVLSLRSLSGGKQAYAKQFQVLTHRFMPAEQARTYLNDVRMAAVDYWKKNYPDTKIPTHIASVGKIEIKPGDVQRALATKLSDPKAIPWQFSDADQNLPGASYILGVYNSGSRSYIVESNENNRSGFSNISLTAIHQPWRWNNDRVGRDKKHFWTHHSADNKMNALQVILKLVPANMRDQTIKQYVDSADNPYQNYLQSGRLNSVSSGSRSIGVTLNGKRSGTARVPLTKQALEQREKWNLRLLKQLPAMRKQYQERAKSFRQWFEKQVRESIKPKPRPPRPGDLIV